MAIMNKEAIIMPCMVIHHSVVNVGASAGNGSSLALKWLCVVLNNSSVPLFKLDKSDALLVFLLSVRNSSCLVLKFNYHIFIYAGVLKENNACILTTQKPNNRRRWPTLASIQTQYPK